VREALPYAAAIITAAWGVAHAVPTGQVIADFEPITTDNRRIVTQEWVAEAVTMWAVAGIVVAATATSATSDTTTRVYRVAAIALVVLAALTVLTGARTRVIWFKICPVLLTASAVLLLIASAA
jgi:hypothetical protein